MTRFIDLNKLKIIVQQLPVLKKKTLLNIKLILSKIYPKSKIPFYEIIKK